MRYARSLRAAKAKVSIVWQTNLRNSSRSGKKKNTVELRWWGYPGSHSPGRPLLPLPQPPAEEFLLSSKDRLRDLLWSVALSDGGFDASSTCSGAGSKVTPTSPGSISRRALHLFGNTKSKLAVLCLIRRAVRESLVLWVILGPAGCRSTSHF